MNENKYTTAESGCSNHLNKVNNEKVDTINAEEIDVTIFSDVTVAADGKGEKTSLKEALNKEWPHAGAIQDHGEGIRLHQRSLSNKVLQKRLIFVDIDAADWKNIPPNERNKKSVVEWRDEMFRPQLVNKHKVIHYNTDGGCRYIFALPETIQVSHGDIDKWKSYYEKVVGWFANEFGLDSNQIDKTMKDPVKLVFMPKVNRKKSINGKVWNAQRFDATHCDVVGVLDLPQNLRWKNYGPKTNGFAPTAIPTPAGVTHNNRLISHFQEQIESEVVVGNRHDSLVKICYTMGGCIEAGFLTMDEALSLLENNKERWGEEYRKDAISSLLKAGVDEPFDNRMMSNYTKFFIPTDADYRDWGMELTESVKKINDGNGKEIAEKKYTAKMSAKNIARLFKKSPAFSMMYGDDFSGGLFLERKPCWLPSKEYPCLFDMQADVASIDEIIRKCLRSSAARINHQTIKDALNEHIGYVRKNMVNEKLKVLHQEWISKGRPDIASTFLDDFVGYDKEKTEPNIEKLFFWHLVAACRRNIFPKDTEFQYCMIFLGEPNIGKTTFFSKLSIDSDLFTQIQTPYAKNGGVDFAEGHRGKLIVLYDEMVSFISMTNDLINEWMTRCKENYRKSYGANPQTYHRRYVAFATANHNNPMFGRLNKNDALARRFPILHITGVDDGRIRLDGFEEARNLLWGQAYEFAKDENYILALSKDDSEAAVKHRNKHIVSDEVLDEVDSIVRTLVDLRNEILDKRWIGSSTTLDDKQKKRIEEAKKGFISNWDIRDRLRQNGKEFDKNKKAILIKQGFKRGDVKARLGRGWIIPPSLIEE